MQNYIPFKEVLKKEKKQKTKNNIHKTLANIESFFYFCP